MRPSDRIPLAILDLATVRHGQPIAEALADTVTLAQHAERTGRFTRIWYAEHHNMASIASSATAVLIAHVAARTERIRLGSGGVMLPNHSPLVVAEQFGTLAELHPGRIDLGLGRAPGTDQTTLRALRRDPRAAEDFPSDIRELQGYLGGDSLVPGVRAVPGQGTEVPLYILGSSRYGAQLAAALGLPYAFASHFAPDALDAALAAYRDRFEPSAQLDRPHAIAALNVIAADTSAQAAELYERVLRARVRSLAGRIPGYAARLAAGPLDDAELDRLVDSPVGAQARHMLTYTAVGDADQVAAYLEDFRRRTRADELMVTNPAPGLQARLRCLDLLAAH
ncbi:MAG TPA: LLM class flavin-dependent oxidoreductase [Dermatophilaceae bacterium]|nr:LLM class flavin-dependent oxidoreductase [Dermatophilaceae bacterium]